VLDQAASLPLPVEQRAVALDEVFQAQEVCMTNALIGVRPVRRIAAHDLPVGPVTRLLQARLAAAFQAEAERA
jgi:4-amino-4-deoxychorismate lyase